MPAPRKYPEELRERAVRLVLEAREHDAAAAKGHTTYDRLITILTDAS